MTKIRGSIMAVFSGARVSVVAGVTVVAMAVTGCGSPASPGPPNARHVDSGSMPAATTAGGAALVFGEYFGRADARQCDTPAWSIDGTVSNRIWNDYSCRKVMTPRDVRWGCHYGAGSGAGGEHIRVVTLSRHPLTKRIGPYTWGNNDICPGHGTYNRYGTYEATVTKTRAGWIVTGYKALSGPGAHRAHGAR